MVGKWKNGMLEEWNGGRMSLLRKNLETKLATGSLIYMKLIQITIGSDNDNYGIFNTFVSV